jgi:hypothetical protein
VALVLSVLFEGLAIQAHIVIGVILVLAGNLVILGTGTLARGTGHEAVTVEVFRAGSMQGLLTDKSSDYFRDGLKQKMS